MHTLALILSCFAPLGTVQEPPRPPDRPSAPRSVEEIPQFEQPGRLGVTLWDGPRGEGRDGAAVSDIATGSPAQACGLQKGDRILSLDGRPVGNARELVARIRERGPGAEISMQIERELTLTVDAAPGDGPGGKPRLGVLLGPDVEEGALRAEGVDPGGSAARAGVQGGDRLLALNDQAISTSERLREAVLACKPGQQIKLRIGRELRARLTGPSAQVEPRQPERIGREDLPELREAMRELRRDLEELRRQMRELQRELRELKPQR